MIVVRPYLEEHVPAVMDFNRRLREGGAPPEYRFPQSSVPPWLPRLDNRTVYNEFYVALEGPVVRGTYALKTQAFSFAGAVRSVGYYHHPFSEGIVNRAYSTLGVQLLRDAQRRQPEVFALGMGGYDRPLPRMLVAMKWSHCLLPFYFRVVRPGRFLRGMRGLRKEPLRRLAMDIAAFTGAGWLGIQVTQATRGQRARRGITVETVDAFGPWADSLWRECEAQYAMIAVRDAATLNALFPSESPRFQRLRIQEHGRTIGWAVISDRHDADHPQTGDLRVGVILDVLALPNDALPVIAEAASALAARGVDLITSNQSHVAWGRALAGAGFFEGPSNFIFAVPKTLADRLPPFDSNALVVHLTRADGDGLYQYL